MSRLISVSTSFKKTLSKTCKLKRICNKLQQSFLSSIYNIWNDTFENHSFRLCCTVIIFLFVQDNLVRMSKEVIFLWLVNNDAAILVLIIWSTWFFLLFTGNIQRIDFVSYGRNSDSCINTMIWCVAAAFKCFRITLMLGFFCLDKNLNQSNLERKQFISS